MRFRRSKAVIMSAVIAAAFCSCSELGDENNRIEKLSAPVTGITTTTRATTVAQTKAVTVTGEITTIKTEKKCRSIIFDGGYVLFIDKNNKYTIMDKDKKAVKSLTLTDDSGTRIKVMTDKDGAISCKSGSNNINEFTYKGNKISVKNGEVYFAGTKLEYYDTSFSTFEIADGIVIECVGRSKFIIKKDGKVVDKPVVIKDDNGTSYTLEAVDEGIEITNSADELMLSLVTGGKYLDVAHGHVIVNGKTMVPPGSDDIATRTTTTTTTTKKKEEEKTETETETETKTETIVITQAPVVYYNETWDDGEIYEEPQQPVVTESPLANNKNVGISSETSEMLGYVNEVRRQYGLSELYGLELLDKAAYTRAKETCDQYFKNGGSLDHNRPDGSSCVSIVDEVGLPDWTAYCENLAFGMNSKSQVQEAFEAWMNSEGHRANILNENVKYMAVACYKTTVDGDDYYFWEQFFYNDTF